MNIQPSEFVKLFMLAYVAGYLVRKQDELRSFTRGILMISIVLAVIGMLLLQEPDLGAVVVICLTVFGMLFLAGVRFWHFMATLIAGMGGMAVLTLISPYRLGRVTGFLDPWADPFNSGFQLVQALIAIGRGEWLGVGLGASVEKLFYLPEAHTDFLLAVIAEELGLVGVIAIIALFIWIVLRAFAIGRQAALRERHFQALAAQGIGIWIGFQAFINMGVNLGVLPTKGLTLPLMSYGGSAILLNAVALAIVLRVDVENRQLMRGGRA
jgi:cell division protein FtsW